MVRASPSQPVNSASCKPSTICKKFVHCQNHGIDPMTKGFDMVPHFEINLWIMLYQASHTLCIVIELMHIEVPPNSTTTNLRNVGVVVMDVSTFGAWVFFCMCTLCVCVCMFFSMKKKGEFLHIYKFQSL
jgi:hypothetical protein